MITQGDLKFWIPIIGMAVTVAIAFSGLRSKVNAMVSREQVNKSDFIRIKDTVEEIKVTVIEINVNQKHIMRELGIN